MHPAGWKHWNDEQNPESEFYAEYADSGPGFTSEQRVDWSPADPSTGAAIHGGKHLRRLDSKDASVTGITDFHNSHGPAELRLKTATDFLIVGRCVRSRSCCCIRVGEPPKG
ncbi:hypothetical protein HAL_31220 [Haladaptatus sp. T7]|nr:hypothetical protein HAL_31220 [Haladaptatus sp. T7]